MDRLHAWMMAQRDLVPEGSAISRALDYSLKRLSRYLDDGIVPIDVYSSDSDHSFQWL